MPFKQPGVKVEYDRQRYLERQTAKRGAIYERRKRMKAIVRAAKNVPCVDCGLRFIPFIMHFDHLPGTKKIGNISNLAHNGSEEQLLAEITKCEVVCANCHGVRTFNREPGKYQNYV